MGGAGNKASTIDTFDSSLTHFETWPVSTIMTRSFSNSLCNSAGSRLGHFEVFELRTSSRVNLQTTYLQNQNNLLN